MNLRRTLLAATMLTLPAAAQAQQAWNAQPVTGFYIGAGVGANWVEKTTLKQSGTLNSRLQAAGFATQNGTASYDTGIATLGSAGWGFGNGLRLEGEFSWRDNRIDQVAGFNRAGALINQSVNNQKGTQQTIGLMVNALYDFNIAGAPWVVPYLGGGIGVAWTNFSSDRIPVSTGSPLVGPAQLTLDNTQTNFAYQAIAGAAFPIDDVPGLAVTLEYRFFGTAENKFTSNATSVRTNASIASGSVKANNLNNTIMLGVRYNFGRVPPPPIPIVAPAPAPAPARTYLVFFDWDKADLTARAREILAEAAQNSRRVQTTRIEVAGHADRSGTPAYNQRLSQRRADAVAAELVARGIARTDIDVTAYGESRPLVPTADGVREPQNRRVEIVLK